MTDDIDEAAYLKEWSDYYAAIGRVVVLAEHCTDHLRIAAMHLSGMFNRRQMIFRSLTRGIPAGAWPDAVEALLGETLEDHDDREVVTALLARYRGLNTERNRVVHSRWFIGWKSSDEEGTPEEVAGVSWPTRGKKLGPKPRSKASLDELRTVGDELREMADAFAALSGLLVLREPGRIARNFEKDESGHYVPVGRVHASPP